MLYDNTGKFWGFNKTITSQTGQYALKVNVRPYTKWTKILVIEQSIIFKTSCNDFINTASCICTNHHGKTLKVIEETKGLQAEMLIHSWIHRHCIFVKFPDSKMTQSALLLGLFCLISDLHYDMLVLISNYFKKVWHVSPRCLVKLGYEYPLILHITQRFPSVLSN